VRTKVVYLAGPYRANSAYETHQNIERAREYAIKLWQLGYFVICPHLNTAHFDGVVADDRFLEAGVEILKRCDEVHVMPGSEDSEGTQLEIFTANLAKIPVSYIPECFK
jgi:hypothetical protein